MDVRLLIDNIVRQTTVLIAHLATAVGLRAPLAHIANQVFLDLVRELEAEGLGRKVVADMFGLALRSYQLKVQRLSESATERNTTLWQALLEYLRERETVTRRQVLRRFRHDDEQAVRGILHDLVGAGLVFKSGRGSGTAYRAATAADLDRLAAESSGDEAAVALVWVTLHGLGMATAAELAEALVIEADALEKALEHLEPPNGWHLYDMSGNVDEWVWDLHGEYPSSPVTDPEGPETGDDRVGRGGGGGDDARDCRGGHRTDWLPDSTAWDLGFRLARSIAP